MTLADFPLRGDPAWSRDRIESAMASGRRHTVALENPVPVHLTYFTAWIQNRMVHFTADIYGLDQQTG
jgi:murein L,D-transpeptidase YcbB/YkuD